MTTNGSFRGRLARRFAVAMAIVIVAASAIGYLALDRVLYERLDVLLLRLASIEAAAISDAPDDQVHFHDQLFLTTGPSHDDVQARFAQVWGVDGTPVLRSANLGETDLPLPASIRQAVTRAGDPRLHTVLLRGERYRSVVYPLGLVGPQHRLHLLQVVTSTRDTEELLRRTLALLGALVVIGTAVGGGVAWWLAGFAVKPVLAIIQQAEALEPLRSGQQLRATTDTDELRRLVTVLNAMLGRIDAVMERQVRFLADAGHAIKTPLTVLRGDVDIALRQSRSNEEYRQVLQQTLQDLKETSAIAEDLIVLARLDSNLAGIVSEDIDVSAVVTRVAESYRAGLAAAGGRLTLRVPPGETVRMEGGLLDRAIGNLVDNAIRYGRPGGHVTVSLSASGDHVCIDVADDGPGIPVEERPRVLERFYRGAHGRATSQGSGLGLAIANAIARSAGGTLKLSIPAEGGGRFSLVVPRRPGSLTPPGDPNESRMSVRSADLPVS